MLRHLVILFFCCVCLPVVAQDRLEIIPLKHRLADQVLPNLRPLVSPGGSISAMDNKLIVRASPQSLAQIRQVLASIDTPARRLMITVKQGALSESDRQAAGVGGTVVLRNGEVDADLRGGITARSTSSRSEGSQQVQTLEGGSASIFLGTAVAIPMQQVIVGSGGVIASTTTEFVDVGSGFQATPHLAGDNVTVTISPHNQRLSGRGIEGSRLSTTVSGRLGEWIRLGGAGETAHRDSRGTLSYGAGNSTRSNEVWLRVEAVE